MSDFIVQFYEAMAAAGVPTRDKIVPDGTLHRVTVDGDKPRSANGWYVLHIDGDFAAGAFGSWKSGVHETWHSRGGGKKLTKEQREKIEEAKRLAEEERQRLAEEAAQRAAKIWAKCTPAGDDHEYLRRKGVSGRGARVDGRGKLVIPARNAQGELRSLQFISPDGTKLFLAGSSVQGCYASIGPGEGGYIICEGYATGATLHQATGRRIVVAFNAGNLEPVAVAIRAKYPDAEITIAGDNDHKTEGNPGVTAARKAARAIGAKAVWPLDIGGTDFNDLAAEQGIDAVRAYFIKEATRPAPEDEAPPPVSPMPDPPDPDADHPSSPVPLGYDRGVYYYYSLETRQVEALKPSEHNQRNLSHLASEEYYWRRTSFFSPKTGVNWNDASDWLMRRAREQGVFDPERIRGRGAWLDAGRAVVHFGDRLIVDGQETALTQHRSRYLYQAGKCLVLDAPSPLPNEDAAKLLQICRELRWSDPLHSYLLAGWIAIAPICGALEWRPSIWITGASGAGKSYVMDHIVKGALRGIAVSVASSTTEAGLRQRLDSDALPVIFDEAEGEKAVDQDRMDAVLQLVRQSASERDAPITKGTQGQKGARQYRMRSAFAFSSINVGVVERADESRITILALEAIDDRDEEAREMAAAHFEHLDALVRSTITAEFSARLIMRSAALMHVIRANHVTFARAAARAFGNQRIGDQIGALLAGAYSLTSSREITYEAAGQWVQQHSDLARLTVAAVARDEERFLSHIKQFPVRVTAAGGGAQVERLLGELMVAASSYQDEETGVTTQEARATLARYGIRYQPRASSLTMSKAEQDCGGREGFWISHTSKPLTGRVLKGTPWSRKPALVLGRLPGAVASSDPIRFAADKERATFVPMEVIL